MAPLFRDRSQAGDELAAHLQQYRGHSTLVLGLARGGVPVAVRVAAALDADVDIYLVRKLGVPGREELAMGAVAEGGEVVLNDDVLSNLRIPQEDVERVALAEFEEIRRRRDLYRPGVPPAEPTGRVCIIVDDGLATGATMRAAAKAVRRSEPQRLVIAVPVAAVPTVEKIRSVADEVICPHTPADFYAVGSWYEDFTQVNDDQIVALLQGMGRQG